MINITIYKKNSTEVIDILTDGTIDMEGNKLFVTFKNNTMELFSINRLDIDHFDIQNSKKIEENIELIECKHMTPSMKRILLLDYVE